ncbi:MAG: tetratricopeptide repeat protein [Bryobacteraceae bacterium]
MDATFLANVARGRARSWYRLGNLERAISYEEEAVRYLPGSTDLWRQLATLYAAAGRSEDANRALARANALRQRPFTSRRTRATGSRRSRCDSPASPARPSGSSYRPPAPIARA